MSTFRASFDVSTPKVRSCAYVFRYACHSDQGTNPPDEPRAGMCEGSYTHSSSR